LNLSSDLSSKVAFQIQLVPLHFGGKDVQPGQDVVAYNDLYGFDLKESEWLTIETKWRRPVVGGCTS
jgi:hypothetical protein